MLEAEEIQRAKAAVLDAAVKLQRAAYIHATNISERQESQMDTRRDEAAAVDNLAATVVAWSRVDPDVDLAG